MNIIDSSLIEKLLPLIGSLAVMYKQLPESFTPDYKEKYSNMMNEMSPFPSSKSSSIIPSTSYTPTSSISTTASSAMVKKFNAISTPSSRQESQMTPLSTKSVKYKQKMHKNMMNLNFNSTNITHRHSSTKGPLNLPRDFGSWSEEERNVHDTPGSMPTGIVSSHQRNKSVNYAHYVYNNEYNFNYNISNTNNVGYLNSSDASDALTRSFNRVQLPNQRKMPNMLDEVLNQQDIENDKPLIQSNENLSAKKKSNNNDLEDIFSGERKNNESNTIITPKKT